jgi:thiamine-phosphate pyrophosphorylase
LIVNDNPYLAQAIDADGVHLGQTDFPAYIARELLGPEAIIGVSTHTKQQAVHALTLPVNYIGVGPFYPPTSKQSEYKPLGIEHVRWVKENVRLPIVAIGGITADKIKAVVQAGADNIAVIREVMGSGAIESKTRELCTIIDRARKESK